MAGRTDRLLGLSTVPLPSRHMDSGPIVSSAGRTRRSGNRRAAERAETNFALVAGVLSVLIAPFVRFDLPPDGERPSELPVLWAPNHRSMADAVVGLVGLHRMGYAASFFVNAEYFDRFAVGRFLALIGAIPVASGRTLTAMSAGAGALRAGRSVAVMAEGRVVAPEDRRDGIGDLEAGVTVLARRTGVPIVPAAIIGTDALLPLDRRMPAVRLRSRHPIVVRFGPPLTVTGRPREALTELRRRLSEVVIEAERTRALRYG